MRTTTRASRTLVASNRPPRPASTTATSTPAAANSESAAAVSVSNCVAPTRSAAARTRPIAASKPASSPPTWIRSLQPETCGDVYAPTSTPSRWRNAAARRVAVDLPFVPTTWIAGQARCGSPSSASKARILPRPNSSGQGESDSIHSVCEGIELAPVPGELLALGLDDLGRRILDEPLIGEHLLRPLDFLAEAVDLGGRAFAVGLHALRPHDGREDPLLVAGERGEDTAPTEALRRLLQAAQRPGLGLVSGVRPRGEYQPRLPVGKARPDLLGHVRHHGMKELQEVLEA